jgi:two-component system LytT family response regulator
MPRALIVDDEPLARKELRRALLLQPDFEIIGECSDAREALEFTAVTMPDVLFLDIQMPGMDGFEVVRAIPPSQLPIIVFVTAYDGYAIEAFEVHATDYLLKPFCDERLQKTLQHVRHLLTPLRHERANARILALIEEMQTNVKSIGEAVANGGSTESEKYIERIAVKSTQAIVFVEVDAIDWIESCGNYVKIYARSKGHIVREKIGVLEQRLNPLKFSRIHRSTIVQLDRIKELKPIFHGDYRVILRDGTQLTLSRNYRNRLDGVL